MRNQKKEKRKAAAFIQVKTAVFMLYETIIPPVPHILPYPLLDKQPRAYAV